MKVSRSDKPPKRIKKILRYVKPYLGLELGVLFLMLIVTGLSLIDPLAMKILIDDVIVDRNIPLLNIIVIALVVLLLLRGGMRIAINYFIQYVGQRILFNIRFDLFRHLEHLHIGFFTETKTGEILARVNNDVATVQNVLTTTLISLVTDLASVAVTIAIMLYLNWKLTLISMTIFPFLFITQFYMGRRIKRKSRETRDKSAEIVSFFEEVFSSIKLVQSFAKERFEAIRLVGKSKELINLSIALGVMGATAAAIAGFLAMLGPILILFLGGRQVVAGTLSLGGLVAFYAYVGRLFRPVLRLAQYNVTIQTARAAIDRIFEFFDIESKIVDAPDSRNVEKITGEIVFDKVRFAYNHGEPVLTDISFQIPPGQKVAIVGPSGVGKSTVVNLLERFYDPTEGRILIDGIDIQRIRLNSLRKHIGLVSQNTVLFNATVRENILYGRPNAPENDIIEAARQANIYDFIAGLPEGFDTIVGERGLRLSGGQSQRLSIARTILKDPEILILDEAMSSLDTKSELLIQRALEPLMRERTSLVIAHRLTSIVDADVILVLFRGRLVESGTHQELMNLGNVYRMLWDQMTHDGDSSVTMRF